MDGKDGQKDWQTYFTLLATTGSPNIQQTTNTYSVISGLSWVFLNEMIANKCLFLVQEAGIETISPCKTEYHKKAEKQNITVIITHGIFIFKMLSNVILNSWLRDCTKLRCWKHPITLYLLRRGTWKSWEIFILYLELLITLHGFTTSRHYKGKWILT